jgi:hypothetical protein
VKDEIFFIGSSDLPVFATIALKVRGSGKTASFATRYTGQVAPTPIWTKQARREKISAVTEHAEATGKTAQVLI